MLVDRLDTTLGSQATQILAELLVVAIILLITWLVGRIVTGLVPPLVNRLTRESRIKARDQIIRLIEAIQPPLQFGVNVLGIWLALLVLGFPGGVRSLIGHAMKTLLIYAIFWMAYRCMDVMVDIFWHVGKRTMRGVPVTSLLDEKLAQVTRQIGKALLIIFGFAAILGEWHFDVAGLVAGLGIGGLAVALAAQSTLANLFGYFMILADEPFRVGDWIVFGNMSGGVEQIGFRSTRVRAIDQSLITVPNNTLMNTNITNWSRLAKRRFSLTLPLSLNSTPDQVLAVVTGIRAMLLAYPSVEKDSVLVQFVAISNQSMDIAVYCFANEADYNKFQAITEDINLKIMKIVADAGASIARVPYDVTLRTSVQEDGQAAQPAALRSAEPGPGTASGDGPDASDH
jgi:MscS family membrane protein